MKKISLGKNKFNVDIDEVTGLPFAIIEASSEKELQTIIFSTLGCEAFNEAFDGDFKFYTFELDNNLWKAKILLVDIQLLTLTSKEKIIKITKRMKFLYKEIWD